MLAYVCYSCAHMYQSCVFYGAVKFQPHRNFFGQQVFSHGQGFVRKHRRPPVVEAPCVKASIANIGGARR